MKALQKEKLQQFRRAYEFLAGGTPDPTLSVPLAELRDALARLDALGTTERAVERSMRAQTIRIRALAKALLVEHMRRIAIAAEAVYPGRDAELGALRALVRQPSDRDNVGMIQAARGVAKSIEPDVDRFVATGLAKDFRTQLVDAATALERAIQARAELAQERRASTEGVVAQVRRARLQLKLLNSLVRPSLANDPERRARWEQALRLTRPGSTKPAEGDGEATDTPPAPPAEEVKAAA